jgi:hypothetical protein
MRMRISVLGVDLGKNVCSIVGLNASGAIVMRRKVRRETLIALTISGSSTATIRSKKEAHMKYVPIDPDPPSFRGRPRAGCRVAGG